MELDFPDGGVAFGDFMSNACRYPVVHLKMAGFSTCDVSIASIGFLSVQNLYLENQVELKGLSGFPDVTLMSFSMPSNNDGPDGGVSVVTRAQFNNPSPAGMHIGEANFEMFIAGGVVVGQMSSKDLYLKQGLNDVTMTGFMKVGSNSEAVADFMSNYLNGKQQEIQVRGLNAGNNPINWLQLTQGNIVFPSVQFPGPVIGPVMNSTIVGITIPFMQMMFDAGKKPRIKSTMVTQYDVPVGFPLQMLSMSGTFGIALSRDSGHVVEMTLVNVPIKSSQPSSKGYATVELDYYVDIDVIDQDGFAKLTTQIMTSKQASIYISGTASPVSASAMGTLTLHNLIVKPQSETIITGFDNFPFIQMDSVSVVRGMGGRGTLDHPAELHMLANITMTSPSDNVACGTGNVQLYGYYEGVNLMTAYINDFVVHPGINKLVNVPCTLYPNRDTGKSNQFLSDFSNGRPSTIEMHGGITSTPISFLQPAFQTLKSVSNVPGMPTRLLTKIHLLADLATIVKILLTKDKHFPSILEMTNPFPTYVKIVETVITVYSGDTSDGKGHQVIGHLVVNIRNDPMVMKPNGGKSISPVLPVEVTGVDVTTLEVFFKDFGSSGVTSLEGQLTVQMGGETEEDTEYFETDVFFYQHNIPTVIDVKP